MKLTLALSSGLLAFAITGLLPTSPDGIKVSAPLQYLPRNNASSPLISPDQEWMAFLTTAPRGLRTLRLDGTRTLYDLTGDIPFSTAIWYRGFTPDSSRVVWVTSDPGGPSHIEHLFSANPDGSDTLRLSPDLGTDGAVEWTSIRISPDSRHVIYGTEGNDLFSVPVDGSGPAVHLPGLTRFSSYTFTPDGAWILLMAPLVTSGVTEVFRIPTDGSLPAEVVSGPMVSGGDARAVRVSSDGAWFLYAADQITDNKVELFRVPSDLSAAPVVLSHPLSASQSVVGVVTAIDPTSTWVAYHTTGAGGRHLYTVPLDGSATAVEVVSPPSALANTMPVFTPDGARVLFENSLAGQEGLYSIASDGSGVLATVRPGTGPTWRLEGNSVMWRDGSQLLAAPASGSVAPQVVVEAAPSTLNDWGITPDGDTLVYSTGDDALFALGRSSGGVPTPVASPPAGWVFRDLDDFLLRDGAVYFLSDEQGIDRRELFEVPLDGSAPPTLAYPPLFGTPVPTVVLNYVLSPNGRHVAYTDGFNVYAGPVDRAGEARRISDPAFEGSVSSPELAFSPDSRFVFFGAQTDATARLYRARSDGAGDPVLALTIQAGSAGPHFFRQYDFTPDGSTLLVNASLFDYFGAPDGRAHALPVDLSGPAVQLAASGSSFSEVRVVADGERALIAQGTTVGTVPLDGSAVLASVLPPDRLFFGELQIAADSARAALRARRGTVDELWALPTDGGPAVLLEPALHHDAANDDRSLVVHPTDSTVAWLRDSGASTELAFGALDGSTTPGILATLPSSVRVQNFLFTPSGDRVVYLADADTPGRFELYAVGTDGLAPPVKLNGPIPAGGSVTFGDDPLAPHFKVTPDASRLVYRADARVVGLPELWSVPMTGGGPAVMLHNPLDTEGIGADFHLLSNSRGILFRGRSLPTLLPLWQGRTDQAGPYKLRSGRFLPHATEISDFQVSATEDRVIYTADQDEDGVPELFSFPLRNQRRSGRPGIR